MFAAKQLAPCRAFHSATIKKHATGKGNAKKHEMYVTAKQRNPDREFISDDEVDALWLLDLALSSREEYLELQFASLEEGRDA